MMKAGYRVMKCGMILTVVCGLVTASSQWSVGQIGETPEFPDGAELDALLGVVDDEVTAIDEIDLEVIDEGLGAQSDQVAQLESELEETRQRVAELERWLKDRDAIIQDMSQADSETTELAALIHNLEDENRLLKAEVDRQIELAAQAAEERDQVRADFNRLFETEAAHKVAQPSEDRAKRIADMEAALDAARSELATLEAERNERERVIAEMTERVAALEQERIETQAGNGERVAELEAALEVARAKVAELETELANRDQTIASLRTRISDLEADLASQSEKLKRMVDLEIALAAARDELSALEAEREAHLTKVQGQSEKINELDQTRERRVSELETELANVREAAAAEKAALEAENEQIRAALGQEIIGLERELASLRESFTVQQAELLEELADTRTALADAETRTEATVQAELTELRSRLSESEGELRQLRETLAEMRRTRDTQQARLEETMSQLAREDAAVQSMGEELEETRGILDNLRLALRSSKEENDELRARLNEAYKVAIDEAQALELRREVAEMAAVDAERKAAMDDLFKQVSSLKAQVRVKDEEIADYQGQLEAIQEQVVAAENTMALHDSTLNAKQVELDRLEQSLQNERERVLAVQAEMQDLRETLMASEASKATLQAEVERVKRIDLQRQGKLNETIEELAEAELEVESLERQLANLRQTQDARVAEQGALESRNALLTEEITRMEQDVEAAIREREAAQGRVDELLAQIEASNREIVDLEAENSRLQIVDEQRRKAMDRILLDMADLETVKSTLEEQLAAQSSGAEVDEVVVASRIAELEAELGDVRRQNEQLSQQLARATAAVGEGVSSDEAGAGMHSEEDEEALSLLDAMFAGGHRRRDEAAPSPAADDTRLAELESALAAANQELERLRAEAATEEEVAAPPVDIRQSDLYQELEAINVTLREKLLAVEGERQQLARAAETAASELIEATNQLMVVREERDELQSLVMTAAEREDEYQEVIERLMPEVEAMEKRVAELTQERQALGNRLLEKEDELAALKVELEKREHRLLKAERVAQVLEEARAEVERAGRQEKLNMHYNMAAVYAREGRFAEAEFEYLQALQIDPADADVHYNLGILYDDELDNPEKAVLHYRRYLQLNPHGPDADRVRTWLMKLDVSVNR